MRLVCLYSALLVILCVTQPSSARSKRQVTATNDLAGSVLHELAGFVNGLLGGNFDRAPVLSSRDDINELQPSAAVQPTSPSMTGFSSCLANMANNFLGGILGGGPTSSAVLSPRDDNSVLRSNAKFADAPTLQSQSSDPLVQSELSERILNGFSARERGQLQNLNVPVDQRPSEKTPSDVDRQRRNMEVLLKLRERHLAKELVKGVAVQKASSGAVQLIDPPFNPTLFSPNRGTHQILGTGPRQESFLDTGGPNFDRILMRENNDFDALGNSLLGNWKKSGLQWTDGDLKLVDVKGNNVLGKDVTIRDRSVDIPVRSWWNFANRFVPMPSARPEHPAAFLAG